jgi:hypothetical protein
LAAKSARNTSTLTSAKKMHKAAQSKKRGSNRFLNHSLRIIVQNTAYPIASDRIA